MLPSRGEDGEGQIKDHKVDVAFGSSVASASCVASSSCPSGGNSSESTAMLPSGSSRKKPRTRPEPSV